MSTNPQVQLDRRMQMMLRPEAYKAWRAKEDARIALVRKRAAKR